MVERIHPRTRPVVPLALGAAGLIPFLATTGWLIATISLAVPASAALALYGLSVLAFIGGIHWGHALGTGENGNYVVSVIPSLVGVAAFALTPPWTLAALALAFAMLGTYDVALYRTIGPRWFASLRLWLSVVVVATLSVGALFAPDVGPLFGLLGIIP